MKKILLGAMIASVALAASAAEVGSANVVGYTKIQLNEGYNMIGVQFSDIGGAEKSLTSVFTLDETFAGYDDDYKFSNKMRVWDGVKESYAFYGWAGSSGTDVDDDPTLDNTWTDMEAYAVEVAEEYGAIETELKVGYDEAEPVAEAIDEMTAWNLVTALCASPHGVLAMSQEIENFVETSTNLASVKMTEPGVIRIGSSQRSCVTAARRAAAAKMEACFVLAGAIVKHEGEYPGWAPAAESPIRDACVASYKKLFGVEPKVKAIHAGLECGLFTEKFPGLDMVSFGPTLRGVHAPGERLDLASLDKFVDLLVDVVTNYR